MRAEAVAGNLAELRWLGLDWDEGPDVGGAYRPYRQSERLPRYEEAFSRLRRSGALFPCYLSRKDQETVASAPHTGSPGSSADAQHVYGAAERSANALVAAAKAAAGRTPSWRFAVDAQPLEFTDACRGSVGFDLQAEFGDFVVRRSDGLFAYQLAVVVDDTSMGITEVVRGADLLTSAAAQIALYRSLDLSPPRFCHVDLLMGPDGKRLAKRRGSLTLQALREAGVPSERVVGLLAHLIGVLPSPRALGITELAAAFDPSLHTCSPALLTEDDLAWLLDATTR